MLDSAYEILTLFALISLGLATLVCLYRAIIGPRTADRIVSVNIICTLTVAMICILALRMHESYLIDVALVYTMLGFLAVVVLCKVYMGVALVHQEEKSNPDNKGSEKV